MPKNSLFLLFIQTKGQKGVVQSIRPTKKVVFTVTCLEKMGQDFFYLFVLQPKQLKCTYCLSLCFTSINFVFIKEKES